MPIQSLNQFDDLVLDPSQSREFLQSLSAEYRGLYVHVPFCFHKCHYCDFYSLVETGRESGRMDAYLRAVTEELHALSDLAAGPLETVFIGGGTPTYLGAELLDSLLTVIRERFELADDFEWTIEANPETLGHQVIEVLAASGVNRVSIGGQSFQPHLLEALQRQHDPRTVHECVRKLKDAGLDRLNIDLIFAIPGQSIGDLHADMEQLLQLDPGHLSIYGLTYEEGTPLHHRLRRGEINRLDDRLEAEMYELVLDTMADAGYRQYEISNFSTEGGMCRHNLLYWHAADVLAAGPGAAGHAGGVRWVNQPSLGRYVSREFESPHAPISQVEQLDEDGRFGERLMLQLRLNEGIRMEVLESEPMYHSRRRAVIRRHVDGGLLQIDDGVVRLSRRGLLMADTVTVDLLQEPA